MTDRATARHRAPQRASTPLSTITAGITLAVSDTVETIGRSSAVFAVSTGLVASMTAPASAMAVPPTGGSSAPTAAVPLLETAVSSVTVSGSLLTDAPLSAPASATLTFDSGALTGTPAPVAAALAARTQPVVSRSVVRTGLATAAAPVKAVVPRAAAVVPKAAVSGPAAVAPAARGALALSLASRYVGIMYRYGGTKPTGFDCSGFTGYVYKQLGVSLPRSAQQQLAAVRRIPRSQAVPGDLVFVVQGSYASHVGIFAGNGQMYDSPRSGKAVSKRAIWSNSVVYGRVTH